MVEAFFNQLAGDKVRAISAGTQPAEIVNPMVVEAMLEVGLDISRNRPKMLTSEMLRKAERVITMGCMDTDACPARFVPTEDWGLQDPEGRTMSDIVKIRKTIKKRIVQLIEDL